MFNNYRCYVAYVVKTAPVTGGLLEGKRFLLKGVWRDDLIKQALRLRHSTEAVRRGLESLTENF